MTQSGHRIRPLLNLSHNLNRYDALSSASGEAMRRRDKAGGKAAKVQRPETLKRRNAPKTASRRSSLVPDKETNVARLTRERAEALEQLAATYDVLKVVSRSTFDLHAVLDALIATATRLCGADMGILRRRVGEVYELAATYGVKSEWGKVSAHHPNMPGRHSIIGRAAACRQNGSGCGCASGSGIRQYCNTEAHRFSRCSRNTDAP